LVTPRIDLAAWSGPGGTFDQGPRVGRAGMKVHIADMGTAFFTGRDFGGRTTVLRRRVCTVIPMVGRNRRKRTKFS